MSSSNQPMPSSSQGPSRKRRNPFRGGHSNQGRPRWANTPNQTNNPQAAAAAQSAGFASASSSSAAAAAAVSTAPRTDARARSPSPNDGVPFASLKGFDPALLQTIIHDMKMTTMTPVQAQTIPASLQGKDMLAQAKTGTGKTIAFLLPAIQRMISQKQTPSNKVNTAILVISPTRELALQIAADAKRLLARHPQYTVASAVGGTGPAACLNRVVRGAHVLIATPGRLLDHFGHPAAVERVQHVHTLVLDEADRLLDMGFMPSIKEIVRALPPKASTKRQGMLFSATINPRVHQFAGLVLGEGYTSISTIPVGETQTHDHVPQSLIVAPTFAHQPTALAAALRREMAALGPNKVKAIVFAPTAAQVDHYAEILSEIKDLPPVMTIHSRLSQSKRTSVTNSYRQATSGILVATDVIARGLDFPGVTSVLQIGLPADKESYIHRLGRTARAGADGRGTFILSQAELPFVDQNLKMVKFQKAEVDLSTHADVLKIAATVEPSVTRKMYQAWLGFYKSNMKTLGMKPADLVREANTLVLAMGAPSVPGLDKRTVGKMGLSGVPGIVYAAKQ